MDLIIAPRARADIANILLWSEETFGRKAMERYAQLIQIAIEQVANNPELPGSCTRPEVAENCRTYHLFHARKKTRARDRIRKPRHLLLYRVVDSSVEIGRVLHDSMELDRHLPPEYRAAAD